jgi:8-oxo-dGTP diphosphatase
MPPVSRARPRSSTHAQPVPRSAQTSGGAKYRSPDDPAARKSFVRGIISGHYHPAATMSSRRPDEFKRAGRQAPMRTVVAALITRGTKLLICQRRRDDKFPLLWEFPGGKVERGESLADALARELREELGVAATIGKEVYRTRHRYSELQNEFLLIFFHASIASGASPANLSFERIEWTDPSALPQYDFLPADQELIRLLSTRAIALD